MVSFVKKVGLFVSLSLVLHAQNWHVELDNDLLVSSDDAYTGGFSITYMGDMLERAEEGVYKEYTQTMRDLFSTLFLTDFLNKHINASIGIQQVHITPNDIERSDPIYNDTPYAGIALAHLSLFAWDDAVFDQYRLSLGVVGKRAMTKEVQENIHRFTGSKNPRGWDNQIGERGSVGFGYLRGMRGYEQTYEEGYAFEWFYSVYGDLGNTFIGGGAGTLVRYGKNMPRNFDVPSILFNNAPNKVLNMHDRPNALGWSLDAGTSFNGIGYYYLYEEGERAGYNFYTPRWMLTSKIGASVYVENFNFSLSFFPVVTRKNTTQSASWGRFSLGWHY